MVVRLFSAIVLLSVLRGDQIKKPQSVGCSQPSGDRVEKLKSAIVEEGYSGTFFKVKWTVRSFL